MWPMATKSAETGISRRFLVFVSSTSMPVTAILGNVEHVAHLVAVEHLDLGIRRARALASLSTRGTRRDGG